MMPSTRNRSEGSTRTWIHAAKSTGRVGMVRGAGLSACHA